MPISNAETVHKSRQDNSKESGARTMTQIFPKMVRKAKLHLCLLMVRLLFFNGYKPKTEIHYMLIPYPIGRYLQNPLIILHLVKWWYCQYHKCQTSLFQATSTFQPLLIPSHLLLYFSFLLSTPFLLVFCIDHCLGKFSQPG